MLSQIHKGETFIRSNSSEILMFTNCKLIIFNAGLSGTLFQKAANIFHNIDQIMGLNKGYCCELYMPFSWFNEVTSTVFLMQIQGGGQGHAGVGGHYRSKPRVTKFLPLFSPRGAGRQRIFLIHTLSENQRNQFQ